MARDGDGWQGIRGGRGRGRGGSRGRGQAGRGQAGRTQTPRPGPPDPARQSAVPANWPPDVVYLTRPVYAGLSAHQRQLLQTQPGDGGGSDGPGHGRRPAAPPLPEIPPILPFGPSPLMEIRTIQDPAHPACGQRGLFAARRLPGGSFVVPYLGVYHRGSSSGGSVGGGGTNPHNKHESDYDLWLDRDADVAVDAVRQGNEARFVNDYRGTGQPRANAEFREVWDPRRGERGMAVFVRPAGRRRLLGGGGGGGPTGIAPGEEILVSYGKGFWEMRQKEAAAAAAAATTTDTAGDEPDKTDAVAATADQLDGLTVGEGEGEKGRRNEEEKLK